MCVCVLLTEFSACLIFVLCSLHKSSSPHHRRKVSPTSWCVCVCVCVCVRAWLYTLIDCAVFEYRVRRSTANIGDTIRQHLMSLTQIGMNMEDQKLRQELGLALNTLVADFVNLWNAI